MGGEKGTVRAGTVLVLTNELYCLLLVLLIDSLGELQRRWAEKIFWFASVAGRGRGQKRGLEKGKRGKAAKSRQSEGVGPDYGLKIKVKK